MKKKILTISIPTYNGSSTIGDMLSILLPQCDDRVEILICNNCSTDNTDKIIEDYIIKYPFIRYIENKRNIGPDSNFLLCMEEAGGKYTLLLSDDDILVENSLKNLLDFLEQNEDLSLVYLNAVGFYEKYGGIGKCKKYNRAIYDNKNFVTNDKFLFMKYAGRMWGFLSCFICLTEAFRSIENTDQFKKTNWLQSYIHILCSEYGNKRLGVVGNITIAAGIYSIVSNFDSSQVDGVNYRKMLDFAISHGFDKKQLDDLFVWRICFVAKRAVVKERASGILKTDIKKLIKCTYKYPKAWVNLYPFIIAPRWLCKMAVKFNGRKKYSKKLQLNREGDIVG
jgi:glycosyltransferase involved in cell wall biosynthesis